MANITYQSAKIGGSPVVLAAASAGGDTLAPNSGGALLVLNGSASAVTVIVAVPGNTQFGQPQPDVAVSVAAGAYSLIGPFPQALADPADGRVHVTYSATASVTVAGVSI